MLLESLFFSPSKSCCIKASFLSTSKMILGTTLWLGSILNINVRNTATENDRMHIVCDGNWALQTAAGSSRGRSCSWWPQESTALLCKKHVVRKFSVLWCSVRCSLGYSAPNVTPKSFVSWNWLYNHLHPYSEVGSQNGKNDQYISIFNISITQRFAIYPPPITLGAMTNWVLSWTIFRERVDAVKSDFANDN